MQNDRNYYNKLVKTENDYMLNLKKFLQAFFFGGLLCLIGEVILVILKKFVSVDDANLYLLLIMISLSAILNITLYTTSISEYTILSNNPNTALIILLPQVTSDASRTNPNTTWNMFITPYYILPSNFGYFAIFVIMLFMLDYVSVVSIKQAPRFSTYKISADTAIYYDTPFYDVIRCNKDTNDEYYKILKNQNYDDNEIVKYCEK